MKFYLVRLTCLLALLLISLPSWANDRVGVNVGDMNSISRVHIAIAEAQAIGADFVRIDMRPSKTPQHYSDTMDLFNNAGIDVLVVIAGDYGWGGVPPRDATHFNHWTFGVCNHTQPTSWGNAYVYHFIHSIAAHVDAIRNKPNFLGLELWNEVTNQAHHLCAEDYAFMLVEAKIRWPSMTLGTSTEGAQGTAYAWQFIDKVANNTNKVRYFRDVLRRGLPWDVVMHHPYANDNFTYGEIDYNLWYQSSNMKRVQYKPVWFTEIGWPMHKLGWNEQVQDQALKDAVDITVNFNRADRIFWYQMYSCSNGTGDFGLRRDCDPVGPSYNRRPAWYSLRDRMY